MFINTYEIYLHSDFIFIVSDFNFSVSEFWHSSLLEEGTGLTGIAVLS